MFLSGGFLRMANPHLCFSLCLTVMGASVCIYPFMGTLPPLMVLSFLNGFCTYLIGSGMKVKQWPPMLHLKLFKGHCIFWQEHMLNAFRSGVARTASLMYTLCTCLTPLGCYLLPCLVHNCYQEKMGSPTGIPFHGWPHFRPSLCPWECWL